MEVTELDFTCRFCENAILQLKLNIKITVTFSCWDWVEKLEIISQCFMILIYYCMVEVEH